MQIEFMLIFPFLFEFIQRRVSWSTIAIIIGAHDDNNNQDEEILKINFKMSLELMIIFHIKIYWFFLSFESLKKFIFFLPELQFVNPMSIMNVIVVVNVRRFVCTFCMISYELFVIVSVQLCCLSNLINFITRIFS